MDFTNRGSSTPVTNPPVNNNPPTFTNSVGNNNKQRRGSRNYSSARLTRWATMGLGIFVVVLVIALLFAIVFGSPKSQSDYINNSKLQAVFLNTGQVYFGNVASINAQYLVLTNIFYLQTNSSGASASTTNSSSNVSLVKLGCELHAPYDQMVINMQQVTFWENLQANGQVAQAVAKYDKQYPHGQTCSSQSNGSSSTTSNVQNTPTKAP